MNDLSFEYPMLYPPQPGDEFWRLAADWSVIYKGEVYRIPYGFATDGASIPCFLRPICGDPMETPRLYAAIVHDFIYSGGDPEATREDADTLYRDMLVALGISKFKALVEYYAIRAFGSSHWHENEKE